MKQIERAALIQKEASRLLADIGRAHEDMRSFVVTGCIGGEGATTMCIALARAAGSDANARALIIDADFATRDLTRLADADGKNGLRQFRSDRSTYADLVVSLGNDLNILPAGGAGGLEMPELVRSGAIEELLELALRDYHFVFWDTRALGKSPDAGLLMSVVPNVLLVTESDVTRMDHFTSHLNEIANARATTVAVVRNRAGRWPFSVGA